MAETGAAPITPWRAPHCKRGGGPEFMRCAQQRLWSSGASGGSQLLPYLWLSRGRSSEQASEQNAIELVWACVVTEVLLFGCVLCALTPETAEVKPRKLLK